MCFFFLVHVDAGVGGQRRLGRGRPPRLAPSQWHWQNTGDRHDGRSGLQWLAGLRWIGVFHVAATMQNGGADGVECRGLGPAGSMRTRRRRRSTWRTERPGRTAAGTRKGEKDQSSMQTGESSRGEMVGRVVMGADGDGSPAASAGPSHSWLAAAGPIVPSSCERHDWPRIDASLSFICASALSSAWISHWHCLASGPDSRRVPESRRHGSAPRCI